MGAYNVGHFYKTNKAFVLSRDTTLNPKGNDWVVATGMVVIAPNPILSIRDLGLARRPYLSRGDGSFPRAARS